MDRPTPEERFWAKVEVGDGCWTWLGSVSRYGNFWVDGKMMRAHRFAYELLVGPISEGLTLDHLCRNQSCVRPDHLEPVSVIENIRRGGNAVKTHCKHGHPFDETNTYIRRDGRRQCKACHSEQRRERRAMVPTLI